MFILCKELSSFAWYIKLFLFNFRWSWSYKKRKNI